MKRFFLSFFSLILIFSIACTTENSRPRYEKWPVFIRLINYKDSSVFLIDKTDPPVYVYNGYYYKKSNGKWHLSKKILKQIWIEERQVPPALSIVARGVPKGKIYYRKIGYRMVNRANPPEPVTYGGYNVIFYYGPQPYYYGGRYYYYRPHGYSSGHYSNYGRRRRRRRYYHAGNNRRRRPSPFARRRRRRRRQHHTNNNYGRRRRRRRTHSNSGRPSGFTGRRSSTSTGNRGSSRRPDPLNRRH